MIEAKPGDKVYRYVWTGGETCQPQSLTVVRVNRLTMTVRTESGTKTRVSHSDIIGFADWDDQS